MIADFTMMNLLGMKSKVYKDAKQSLISKDVQALELESRKQKEEQRIAALFHRVCSALTHPPPLHEVPRHVGSTE